jgi:hypothetical protein
MLLLCIYISDQIKAQTLDTAPWCPPGATWVYAYGTWGSISFNEYKYLKDTIYEGINAKKIQNNRISFFGPTYPYNKIISYIGDEYLYLSNDSLFYFDPINGEYIFYFNFNANQSTIIPVKNPRELCLSDSLYPDSDTLQVLSTDNDTMSNIIFNVFKMNDIINNKNYIIGDIYKNIGSSYCFLPRINFSNCILPSSSNNGEGIVCYFDSLRGNLFYGSLLLDCSEIWSGYSLLENEIGSKYSFNLYPNPAQNNLYIEYTNHFTTFTSYQIFNIAGQLLKQGNLENNSIPIQEIPEGVHILTLFDESFFTFNAKFLKK